jgi:hypothetical protein
MKKTFSQKSFNYFFTPLPSRVNILKEFLLQVTLRCQQSDFVPLFATGVTPVVQLEKNWKILNHPNVIFSGLRKDD